MSYKNSIWLVGLCLGFIIFLFYTPSLHFTFYGDDFAIVQTLFYKQQSNQLVKQVISDFTSTWLDVGGNFYRPFVIISYVIDLLIWKTNPWGWHFTNILIHVLNCILVFLTIVQLLQKESAKHSWLVAGVATLFFGLRPLLGEVVFWISGRGDSLSLLGMLIAFYSFLLSNGAWNRWMVISLLGFVLALGSKEPAATFPAVIGAWLVAQWLSAPIRLPFRKFITQTSQSLLPYILMVGGYLLLRRVIFGSFLEVYPAELVPAVELTSRAWWMGKITTFHYFVGPLLSKSLWVTSQNYLLVLLLVGGSILGFRYQITRLLWWFGAIWFVLLLPPSLQQIYVSPFGEGERLLYIFLLPFTLMIISPLAIITLKNKEKWLGWSGMAILVVILCITLPWTRTKIEKWERVADQMDMALEAIPLEADSVPDGQVRVLILPSTIDGIHFARNAQGPMMSLPFQTTSRSNSLLVTATDRPCQLSVDVTDYMVYDYRCWNIQNGAFEPTDPSTYNASDYPYFWLLNSKFFLQYEELSKKISS
jgi:hypothetical protein